MNPDQKKIRSPAVAGSFYPTDVQLLASTVDSFLSAVKSGGRVPKALIVPHAGYVHSGPVAAVGYARINGNRSIKRVVLLGPAHRVGFYGIAATSVDFYETPLGRVPIDQAALPLIETLPQVTVLDRAHEQEHSLEVQVPFLQRTLKTFSLVPLVVGETLASEVGEVLDVLWGGPETLIVVSADLSHYHEYPVACEMDAVTARAIESLDPQKLTHESTCGFNPVRGLMYVARKRKLIVETLDLKNSGDVAGIKRGEVVGYGAWGFFEKCQSA